MSKRLAGTRARGRRLRLESLEDRTNPYAGALDPAFGGDGNVTTPIGPANDYGQSMAVQADGKIVVAGSSFNGTDYDFALARYNPDGTLDTSFDGDGKVTTDFGASDDVAVSVAVQADGKIVAAGYSATRHTYLLRPGPVQPDGTLDDTFDGDGMLTTDFGLGGSVATPWRCRRTARSSPRATAYQRDRHRLRPRPLQHRRVARHHLRRRRQGHHRHRPG